jgi:hypothetical protein
LETGFAVCLGILWLAAIPISLMSFGAPGTVVDARAWAFVLTLWSYPVWTFGPLVIAWSLFVRGNAHAALRLSLLPLVAGLAAAIIFWR